MTHDSSPTGQFRVLLVGGGVGALEAALALRELAGDRVATTMLAPEPEFAYRPMRVREPFAYPAARTYPLKEIAGDLDIDLGGIAAQQADTAAQAIAALAGARVAPKPFHPTVHAILLGGDKPLYLSAHITGGHGSSSEISETPMWSPPAKIAAKYLAPYLEARDQVAGSAG